MREVWTEETEKTTEVTHIVQMRERLEEIPNLDRANNKGVKEQPLEVGMKSWYLSLESRISFNCSGRAHTRSPEKSPQSTTSEET